MRPSLWHPPIALSTAEHAIIKRMRRAKLFVFLRQHRHELFADAFQQELMTLYKDHPQGHPPVPPAQLALATIVQAYTQVSDDEVIEATTMDRRWQVVLDCLDTETPFSKGTLVAFRQRMLAQQMDRRLLERTVEIAATSGAFGPRQLRAALDSSPLWGAGRVADTYNLLGHTLCKALGVLARQQGQGLRAVAEEAGVSLVAGPSHKATLALDGDDPSAQQHALTRILDELHAVEHWLDTHPAPAAGDRAEGGRRQQAFELLVRGRELEIGGAAVGGQGHVDARHLEGGAVEMRRLGRALQGEGDAAQVGSGGHLLVT